MWASIPFWKFLRFFLVYLILFVAGFSTINNSTTFGILSYFFYVIFLQYGIYVLAFTYGLIFQYRNVFNLMILIFFTIVLFVLGVIAFSVWFPLFPFMHDYAPYHLKSTLSLAIPQSLSFLAGCLVTSGFRYVYLRLKNRTN
jgi:hypothetical protein